MESYRVRIKTSAIRELEGIGQKSDRQRLARKIAALAEQPRPAGCQKLAGALERYRIRQGRYRVVNSVDDESGTVIVFKIGHRKDVYR